MKEKIKKEMEFILRNKFIFLAFAVPVFITVVALMANGIYPFGDKQIPIIDMYHQYVPFLSELQHKLQNGESLFYTWNGAGGSNFYNLMAYYCASPLNLLLVLVPSKFFVEGITVILVLKIGFASAFMAIYLRAMNKVCNLSTVAFGTMYGLCAFVMGYYWCIMWLDAVALLPLVVLGLNKTLREESPVMYVVTLALTIICNYYIAIMVCIFIALYYVVCYIVEAKNPSKRHFAITTLGVVSYSILGVGISAVVLLPTYYSMQQTFYISSEMPEELSFYRNAMEVFNQLLPEAHLTFRSGAPNLYCGLLVVILLIFYIINKEIKLKEKAANMAFLAFLFLSLNINKLDFMWHGFHFPNELPFRYSFVVSFILVAMAYKAFIRIDQVKVNAIWGAMAGILGWYIICQTVLSENIDDINKYFYFGVAFLVSYTVLMILYRKRLLDKVIFIRLLTLIVALEMTASLASGFGKAGNTDREIYFKNYDQVINLVSQVDDEFNRVEMSESFILNTPALYHYKGISQFSSSINCNATEFMEKIGMEGEPGKNRFNYVNTNPVTNAILDIKYIISKDTFLNDYDLKEVNGDGTSFLYENKYAPGMAYMTPYSIWSWDVDLDNPISVLDDYVRAATDNEYYSVFEPLHAEDVIATNRTLSDNGEDSWIVDTKEGSGDGQVELTYKSTETKKYYVFVEAAGCEAICYDKYSSEEIKDICEDSGSVINLGIIEEGEEFAIRINYADDGMGAVICHVASVDEEAWDQAYSKISRNPMTVEEWSSGYVKGSINASEDGVLVTSIPYENGWTVKVDGKRESVDQLVGDQLIGINIDKGSHVIEFSFRPPGLIAGAVITLMSIILLIFNMLIGKRPKLFSLRRSKLTGKAQSDPEESDCNKEEIDFSPEEEQEGCPD